MINGLKEGTLHGSINMKKSISNKKLIRKIMNNVRIKLPKFSKKT